MTALAEARAEGWSPFAGEPRVVGGRYGLSSKEFTPTMVKAVFDELSQARPRNHFTVGIKDDVTHRSLDYDDALDIEAADVVRAVFFGLGSDGTVGSNKNTIKIIGETTPNFAQGYFVYDSKKAGAVTISHLRFGPRPIRSSYLIRQASYVACHAEQFVDKLDVLDLAAPGATFVLNTTQKPDAVWGSLPREVQEQIVEKKLRFYAIDAYRAAEEAGLGRHLSTVMQACFFSLSHVLPPAEATARIKASIEKAYGKRGVEVVNRNFAAVDGAAGHLFEVPVPEAATAPRRRPPTVPREAPDFVQRVTAVMLAGKGDSLPVSAFPVDGTWPTGTSQWEKRGIALSIPVWDPAICIQCNKCALVCPHAAIRCKVFDPREMERAPAGFVAVDYKSGELAGMKYTVQVAPDDCTGCDLCAVVCPAKDKGNPRHKSLDMKPAKDHRDRERENFAFLGSLPDTDRRRVHLDVKGVELLEPLFEFSGACAGCGETPYIKLMTQLFGDRTLIANATGCTSIYGGNLPTTPYRTNQDGRGPAWSNSLFEDNAEFGLGLRLGVDAHARAARLGVTQLASTARRRAVQGPPRRRRRTTRPGSSPSASGSLILRRKLAAARRRRTRAGSRLLADYLVEEERLDRRRRRLGVRHRLRRPRPRPRLRAPTSTCWSWTPRCTPTPAVRRPRRRPSARPPSLPPRARRRGKKDLGMLAMTYGNAYVASVAFGAKDVQTVNAFREAEAYPGPSLIIAYSHCIAHGYDMSHGLEQQKLAVDSGVWPLYRFDPRRLAAGEPPLKLDSGGTPKVKLRDYMKNEGRFRMVELKDPKHYAELLAAAERYAGNRHAIYEQLAGLHVARKEG